MKKDEKDKETGWKNKREVDMEDGRCMSKRREICGNPFSFRRNLLNYALFWRGEQKIKIVRPTGKVFDDIQVLTGDHRRGSK